MNKLTEAFQETESAETAVRAGIASGYRLFLSILSDLGPIKFLREQCKSEDIALKVLQRILKISDYAIDLRFENPSDTALAAYLFILYRTNDRLALIGSVSVLRASNCWWARKVAEDILKRMTPTTYDKFTEVKVRELRKADITLDSGRVADYVFFANVSPDSLGHVYHVQSKFAASDLSINLALQDRAVDSERSGQFRLLLRPCPGSPLASGFSSAHHTATTSQQFEPVT